MRAILRPDLEGKSMKYKYQTALALLALITIWPSSVGAQTIDAASSGSVGVAAQMTITAKLHGDPKIGDNMLMIHIVGSDGKPVAGAKITLSVAMTNMDMGTTHPKVSDQGKGDYEASVAFSMAGPWRVAVKVEVAGQKPVTKNFDFKPKAGGDMQGMEMHGDHMDMGSMMGRLGPWSMQREGSGTSWLPDSSPMFMKSLPKQGAYDVDAMGFITFNTNKSGGNRGDSRFFSNSMLMLMARRETGGGILGLSLMASLDPVFNGEFGYPDLFQTGETAYGQKLTDYQHPHDLLAEVTASYSHPIGHGLNGFVYGGPVGEPALGGPTFMHRPSGMEIPEAPISHHWFDSTHIAWGVVTAGVNTEKWQVEGSVFNGHEPDENRYSPDKLRLDSASGRITFAPNRNLALNASYGFMNSPESTSPGVDEHRLTSSAVWNLPFANGDNFAFTAAFGRNIVEGKNSDSFLTEATYLKGPNSIFARWEHVMKDELVGVPPGNYMINKFLVGGVRNLMVVDSFECGLGAYAGFYIFPGVLEPFYGRSPVTLGAFLRIRPGRMNHDMGAMH
jgi:hypothetical protein